MEDVLGDLNGSNVEDYMNQEILDGAHGKKKLKVGSVIYKTSVTVKMKKKNYGIKNSRKIKTILKNHRDLKKFMGNHQKFLENRKFA